jgi:hypothetical protein
MIQRNISYILDFFFSKNFMAYIKKWRECDFFIQSESSLTDEPNVH